MTLPVRDDCWVESLLEKARGVPKERLANPSKISNPRFVSGGTINTQTISEKYPNLTLLNKLLTFVTIFSQWPQVFYPPGCLKPGGYLPPLPVCISRPH
jgi:hypothetical protein